MLKVLHSVYADVVCLFILFSEVAVGSVSDKWKFINEILYKNKKDTLNAVKNSDSVLRKNDMVNYFNYSFLNVKSQLAANHTVHQNIDPLSYINFNSKSFFFHP